MTVYYMSYLDQLPQLVPDYYRVVFPTLSHVHVVKQDIEGIHRHLVLLFFLRGGGGGGLGGKVLFGIIFVGG